MSSTIRILRLSVVWSASVVGLLALSACGPPGTAPRRDALDSAIEMFLAGHHSESIEALNRLLDDPLPASTKREIYYYLGRSYLEQDDLPRAIDAFATGVQLGDTGPCLVYLQRLRGRMEGSTESVARSPVITRGQLCAVVERWLASGQGRDPEPDPVAAMTQRGWLERLADGKAHAEAPVTRAALFVFVARMCASISCAEAQIESYSLSDGTVSGRELVAQLGRVMPWPPPDGR